MPRPRAPSISPRRTLGGHLITRVDGQNDPHQSRIDIGGIQAAARRLNGVAHRTRLIRSSYLTERLGVRDVAIKPECLQRTGSFKFRGAFNAVSVAASESRLGSEVVTYSSGNHAQGLALAAALHGVRATIFMPEDSPPAKVAAVLSYGASIQTFDRYAVDGNVIAKEHAVGRDALYVHPFDDPNVLCGQGTVGMELFEDFDGALDVVLVPVGGGALAAGTALSAGSLSPTTRVYGVEPLAGDDTRRSLEAGSRIRIPVPRTIADGQQLDIPGALTFPINQRVLAGCLVADDDQILEAMRVYFERCKLVTEPSGAITLAAALAGQVELRGARLGLVVSGGNVGVNRFLQLMAAAA